MEVRGVSGMSHARHFGLAPLVRPSHEEAMHAGTRILGVARPSAEYDRRSQGGGNRRHLDMRCDDASSDRG